MKVDPAKKTSITAPRGRGTYAPQACSICRGKKTKCDGVKPICGPCTSTGRHDECSWGRETGRKPRTEAHFEAMRKRADALEEYVNLLESVLERCRREHGGFSDNGESYLQFRPRGESDEALPDAFDADSYVDGAGDPSIDDHTFSQELCLPTRNLKLEEGNLLLHGNTAVFRFAPEAPIPKPNSRFPPNGQAPRYVLLLDGTNTQGYNPDFDWSRYLPTSVPLDRREHDKLLDLLFKFFMSWCLRIVPDLFLRDMYQTLSAPRTQTAPKTAHYSPMLHNALIALATAFSDDARIRDLKSRQAFASLAKSHMESECQQPNISVVHALSVLGSYHSGLGEQTLGYLYFGMSARMSQALGLSIDCSAWVKSGLINENDMFDRNWAYWTIFTQDVCWSLYVGRDFSIPATFDVARIPIPHVDAEFDSVQWHHPPSGIPPQSNLLSTTFAASCELLLIARRIMDVVNGLNNASVRHEVNDELISNIDLKLNTWKSNLSTELDITLKSRPMATPHRLMMHCTYWWFFILLHRPFYNRRQRLSHNPDRDIDHVKLCKRAAENIVELLGTWRSLYTLRYAPITLVQTAFSAGTIYLLGAVQAATGLRVAQESLKHSMAQAQLCVQYLLEIGKSWQCATNIAEILRRLLQEQLKPLLARRAIHDGKQVQAKDAEQSLNMGLTRSPTSPSRRPARRRSPSQRRSLSRVDERSRGRTAAGAHHTNPLPQARAMSSDHHGPVLHAKSFSQPQSPFFSIPSLQSSSSQSSQHNVAFDQSWNLDRAPVNFAADGSTSPLYSTFGQAFGSDRNQIDMAIDVDLHSPSSDFSLLYPNNDINDITGRAEIASTGMDPSSFLAMLGGEPLSNAPFLPTFDSYSPPSVDSAPYSPTTSLPTSGFEGFEPMGEGKSATSRSDLAIIAHLWDQTSYHKSF